MQEKLFRGKLKKNDEWATGGIAFGGAEFEGKIYITSPDVEDGRVVWMHEVYPETVGQYTGMKDKNGKEIYEGDIVKGLVMFQDNIMEVKGVVKFVHGRFVIAEYNCSLYEFANIPSKKSNEIEVIGNKYQNP